MSSCYLRFLVMTVLRFITPFLSEIPLVGKFLHALHWRCFHDCNLSLFVFYINPFPYLQIKLSEHLIYI